MQLFPLGCVKMHYNGFVYRQVARNYGCGFVGL